MGDHGSAFNFVIGARKKPECGKPLVRNRFCWKPVSVFFMISLRISLEKREKCIFPIWWQLSFTLELQTFSVCLDLYRLQRIWTVRSVLHSQVFFWSSMQDSIRKVWKAFLKASQSRHRLCCRSIFWRSPFDPHHFVCDFLVTYLVLSLSWNY